MPDPGLRGRFGVVHRYRSNRFDWAQAEGGPGQLSGGYDLCLYLIWFGLANQTTLIYSSCRLAMKQLCRRSLQQRTETTPIEMGMVVSAGNLAHRANLERVVVLASRLVKARPLQVKGIVAGIARQAHELTTTGCMCSWPLSFVSLCTIPSVTLQCLDIIAYFQNWGHLARRAPLWPTVLAIQGMARSDFAVDWTPWRRTC